MVRGATAAATDESAVTDLPAKAKTGSTKVFAFKDHRKKAERFTLDIDGDTFTCKSRISGYALLSFAEAGAEGSGMHMAVATRDFILNAVVSEDKERFEEFLLSEEGPSIGELSEIADFLVGEYVKRPTT